MLTTEQLIPYFSRVHYSKSQKQLWFHDRAGVLYDTPLLKVLQLLILSSYGFALAFFILLKIPLVGVLIYGVAEASTAYLITKNHRAATTAFRCARVQREGRALEE